jgi:hypothetical protein
MYGLFAKTRRFDRLATMPMLLEVIERVLGSAFFNLSAPTGIDIGPNERPQIPSVHPIYIYARRSLSSEVIPLCGAVWVSA